MQAATGPVIGRYRVERFLGAGGMADVYVVRDLQLGRLVALKILRATDPARIERFIREAQLASSLNHPAIVSVYDAGTVDSMHYLAMELIEGQTLDVWTRSTRDVRKIVEVLAAVADGLARAHAGGIVHRDLKPQNVMVARGGHPKILDFGVAKLTDPEPGNGDHSNTAPSHALGTGAYMSPEQAQGEVVDSRSDIFSFGAVAYEALTGNSPFARGTVVESMHAVLHDEPPATNLPTELVRIIRKCLVKDREERFQSIKDVALDLRESMREPATAMAARRPRLVPAVGTLLVALLLIVMAIAVTRDRRSSSTLVAKPTTLQPVMLRMTNSGNISAGAISPDGKYIVHSTLDGENQTVWVKQIATGTNVRIIPPDLAYYLNFEVSADSNYIYYSVSKRSEPNIMDLRQIPMLGGQSRVAAHD
ncbi:MAG: protein kinase domain-containing protein, partial [Longimicrobiales bacterium]